MMNPYRRYFPPGRSPMAYGPPRFVWFLIGAGTTAFFMNLGYKRGTEHMYGRPPPHHHDMHHGPPCPPPPGPPGPPPPGSPPGERGWGPPWDRQWGNQSQSSISQQNQNQNQNAREHDEQHQGGPGVMLPKPAAAEPGRAV